MKRVPTILVLLLVTVGLVAYTLPTVASAWSRSAQVAVHILATDTCDCTATGPVVYFNFNDPSAALAFARHVVKNGLEHSDNTNPGSMIIYPPHRIEKVSIRMYNYGPYRDEQRR